MSEQRVFVGRGRLGGRGAPLDLLDCEPIAEALNATSRAGAAVGAPAAVAVDALARMRPASAYAPIRAASWTPRPAKSFPLIERVGFVPEPFRATGRP